MNSKYRIVFIDLDGTLLNDDKKISEESIRILQKLNSLGIPVILTSGRMPQGVLPFKKILGINRPIITYGGGLVLDEHGRKLLDKGLTYQEAEKIAHFVSSQNIVPSFNFYTDSGWYTNNLSHPMEQYEARMIGFDPEEGEFYQKVKPGEKVAKCLFAGNEEEIDALLKIAKAAFPEHSVIKSQYFLLEIYNKEVSKAAGIQAILDYYQLNIDEAIGIGDSYNDLEMLELVGLPVIMKNAPQDLQNNPKYQITSSDNNHNGAAEFLKNFFKLENEI